MLKRCRKIIKTKKSAATAPATCFEDIISDRTSLILRYNIEPRDFTHGGRPPTTSSAPCCGWAPIRRLARRCGIAIYEAEMNLIIHTTNGGIIRVEIEPTTF